jgi:hypothetical protein
MHCARQESARLPAVCRKVTLALYFALVCIAALMFEMFIWTCPCVSDWSCIFRFHVHVATLLILGSSTTDLLAETVYFVSGIPSIRLMPRSIKHVFRCPCRAFMLLVAGALLSASLLGSGGIILYVLLTSTWHTPGKAGLQSDVISASHIGDVPGKQVRTLGQPPSVLRAGGFMSCAVPGNTL